MVKQGGFFVYPAEIERVLGSRPAVAEAAVVGMPFPELGEAVVAFIVLREAIDTRLLFNHCRITLASTKQPRQIKVVESMPRSPAGKVLKSALVASLGQ